MSSNNNELCDPSTNVLSTSTSTNGRANSTSSRHPACARPRSNGALQRPASGEVLCRPWSDRGLTPAGKLGKQLCVVPVEAMGRPRRCSTRTRESAANACSSRYVASDASVDVFRRALRDPVPESPDRPARPVMRAMSGRSDLRRGRRRRAATHSLPRIRAQRCATPP